MHRPLSRGRRSRAFLPLREVNSEPVETFYRRFAIAAGWLLRRLTRQDWDDGSRLPRTGGIIVCANHISNADPVLLAHYLVWSGRFPRFLAKASLFTAPGVGALVRATGQIPVSRRSHTAGDALDAAAAALVRNACVLIYPEGTVTHEPNGWPMTGHNGAVRLALRTGAPIIPVGQWGANAIFDRWHVGIPRLWPRPTVVVRTGPPVDLEGIASEAEGTDRVMAAITALVEEIRGESAPEVRYNLRRDWAPGIRADGRPLNEADGPRVKRGRVRTPQPTDSGSTSGRPASGEN